MTGLGAVLRSNPFALKLAGFMVLSDAELAQLDQWNRQPTQIASRRNLQRQGDETSATCLMLEGWAARYKDLPNGKRQIVGLMLPGDMCDLHDFLIASSDHGISTLGNISVALIPGEEIIAALHKHPRLTRALWWSTLIDLGIAREWVLNLGQRDATTRVASFYCELRERIGRIEGTEFNTFSVPLTQSDLGDAMGLTPVHVNRVMRTLRELGLLEHRMKELTIYDYRKLKSFCGFDATYLRLKQRASHIDTLPWINN